MDQTKRYSIVCYLDGKVLAKVRAIQERLFEITGSRKCLDAWMPHITIGSGIIVSSEKQKEVDEAFQLLTEHQSIFDVSLRGFGGTTDWKGAVEGILTPYVLWINVDVNEKLLKLFNEVSDDITSHYDTFYPRIKEYIPHVTVAYGDLTKEGYEKGKEYLEGLDFDDVIKVSHIALVENLPEEDVMYKKFSFQK